MFGMGRTKKVVADRERVGVWTADTYQRERETEKERERERERERAVDRRKRRADAETNETFPQLVTPADIRSVSYEL
jgi:hypothetical protein